MKRKMTLSTQTWYSLVILVLLAVQTRIAFGRSTVTPSSPRANMTVQISQTGDAHLSAELNLSKKQYSALKKTFSNPRFFARMLNNSLGWSEVRNVTGRYVDQSNKVTASLTTVGYSKPYREGRWVIDLRSEDVSLSSLDNGIVTFQSSTKAQFGAIKSLIQFRLPQGSTNHEYDSHRKVLTYNFVPQANKNKTGDADFFLDVRPKLMSSLASVYGDEKFDNFWVARSMFKNSGGKVIRNLRIRHRIAGLSNWSRWNRTKVVYPNQTVIAPFFPVLDIEKVARFTEARTAMVEVEYKYTMDGKTVGDTDSNKTKILARNEVLWGKRRMKESLTWQEGFNNSPMIVSAFCSSNDPVMQQVAGVVTRMGGGHSQSSDKGAMHFLKTMWKFMEINRISYQSPVAKNLDGFLNQHIKYGRDVIANRAGTCIDLAVLWTSVAKAVGLKSYIVMVPGHAFPVIQLPSGKLVAIESTNILHTSFDKAVQRGEINLKIAQGKITKNAKGDPLKHAGMIIVADISKLQNRGVHCLDLPRVVDGYLLKLGYKIEVEKKEPIKKTVVKDNKHPRNLVGIWTCIETYERVGIEVKADGKYTCMIRRFDDYGNMISEEVAKGTWAAKESVFYISTNLGRNSGKYQVRGNQMIIKINGATCVFNKHS